MFLLSIRAASPMTSPNCVEVLIELADWLRAKSRADAIRLILIYTVRKIVGTKSRLEFILN